VVARTAVASMPVTVQIAAICASDNRRTQELRES
jgi:hypothetical protein